MIHQFYHNRPVPTYRDRKARQRGVLNMGQSQPFISAKLPIIKSTKTRLFDQNTRLDQSNHKVKKQRLWTQQNTYAETIEKSAQ